MSATWIWDFPILDPSTSAVAQQSTDLLTHPDWFPNLVFEIGQKPSIGTH